MSYTTKDALTERYGERRLVELTDTEPPYTQQVQDGVLARAIAVTDGLIDAHVAVRYALPLASTPPLLADLAARLTYAALHVDGVTEKVKADADAALALLKGLAAGTLALPGVAPLPTAAANATVVVSGGAARLFGRAGLAVL